MADRKYYQSRAWLYRRYVIDKKTITQIADECGASVGTIQKYLEKFELIRNKRSWK